MASPEMTATKEAVLEARRAGQGAPPPTVEEMRAGMEVMLAALPPVTGVSTEAAQCAGLPAEWTVPAGTDTVGTILYFHGGGYFQGSIATHRRLVAALCLAGGTRGLSVGYRLAPEHRFPAAVDDAVAAYRWLISDGGEEPDRVIIAGDSAGGGLTFATLIALRDAGDPMPAGGFGISPWTDLAGTGKSLVTRKDQDPFIDPGGVDETAIRYAGDADRRNPLVSPLYGDLHGLPPLLIHVGGAEVLYDDAARMADAARSAGVEVEFADWPDAFHVWHMMVGMIPEADEAVAAAGAWIAKRVG
ncbi:MAG TPA: alpha/beta hydrolase [Acidimicrobiales bacterium]|nr:alpha/beta hydrolase [Acidimicrobiales bacterium]